MQGVTPFLPVELSFDDVLVHGLTQQVAENVCHVLLQSDVAREQVDVRIDLPPPFGSVQCRGKLQAAGAERLQGLVPWQVSLQDFQPAAKARLQSFIREYRCQVLVVHEQGRPADFPEHDHWQPVITCSAADALEHIAIYRPAVIALGRFSDMTMATFLRRAFVSYRPTVVDLSQLPMVSSIVNETSDPMRALLDQVHALKTSDATVHIVGETGAGKERIARMLHERSSRAAGPFVAFNCAGMPEGLLYATLFGHEKGAFTGADHAQAGLFARANHGTLFLDEVGECSPMLQASLLRVLQEREIVSLGGGKSQAVDVRVISATHRDLKSDVKQGRFRQDLYYRLVVLSLTVPPLRSRPADIVRLAHSLLEDAHLTPAALVQLCRYSWPGNVRELQNEMQRLSAFHRGNAIEPHHLSPEIAGAVDAPSSAPFDEQIEQLQKTLITHAVSAENGVTSRAAVRLGMDVSRLAKMRRRLGV